MMNPALKFLNTLIKSHQVCLLFHFFFLDTFVLCHSPELC